MDSPDSARRTATLLLVDAAGVVLGALLPIEVATPWWNDIAPLVRAVQQRDGLHVTVLRLLGAERDAGPGGAVWYLAQVSRPVAGLRPWTGLLNDDPLRLPYARVGGPQADLGWASSVLQARGLHLAGAPEQIRTWNLSSLWRLPTSDGSEVWLKAVPPFFAHEGTVIDLLASHPVPRLLGRDGPRVLLAPVAGEDLYEADESTCKAMIDLLVDLQSHWLGRGDELAALGLPDWRGTAFTAKLETLLERRAAELVAEDRGGLEAFVQRLPQRFAAIAGCGLSEGLVHGDFHRGNFRGESTSLTLLDWGDSGIGHPLLDQAAFLDRVPVAFVGPLCLHWTQAWQRVQPRAEVDRAAALLAPVAAARQALIYQHFLDNIEASEHPYHRHDVVDWLQRTATMLRRHHGASLEGQLKEKTG
jgi:Ser/Thr protein kinase RdoA (MazF antagonist)